MATVGSTANCAVDLAKYGPPRHDVLTRYRLLKHIGSGGFGDVLKALHLGTNTFMAMKLLRYDPTEAHDDAWKETWNIYKAGKHVNIALVYDHFPFSSTHHAITMELFDMDLSGLMKHKERRFIPLMVDVSLQRVTGLVLSMCDNSALLLR